MGFVSRNVGAEVRSHLVDRFGFIEAEDRAGRYRLPVDAQHQLVITDGTWGENGGHTSARLVFEVARRDINELRSELLDPRIDSWWPTVKVNKLLFGGDSKLGTVTDFRMDGDAVAAYCDYWLPKFVAEAPKLSYVREMFGIARTHAKLARQTRFARMFDSMLAGTWAADSEPDFFPNQFGPDDREKILGWVAAHPDGIERELAD